MFRCPMQLSSASQRSTPRVIVIAGSIEGLEALARLLHQLPSTVPVPVVVHLHGPRGSSIKRLTRIRSRSPSKLKVVFARDVEVLSPGFVYVIPVGDPLVFIAADVIGPASQPGPPNVDDLFASAAHWYGSEVIGVVLSGLGADGTQGFQAITRVDGIRVVQSPFDATFPGMPASALIGDNVQFAIMLDQMGTLLMALVTDPESVKVATPDVQAELTRQVLTVAQTLTKSLDRSIEDVLRVARDNLVMDIVLVTRQRADQVVISHSTPGPEEMRMQGMSYPTHQSLCQRVLEGRLPAVMPDVEALRSSHELPILSLAVGAFMATPIWLSNGTLYGMLCCFNAAVSRELDQRHYLRLQLSARQIARLVNETGDS